MERYLKSSILTSTLLFCLGILLIFESEVTVITISYVIGSILVAAGTFALIRYISVNKKGFDASELDLLYGIVTIILGILIITHPQAIASIIPIILGIAIIISSASKIQYAFNLKNNENELWKTTMAIAIISTICGIVLLFNPFAGALLLMRIVGIFIVIYSILDIVSTYIIKKNVEEFKSIAREDFTEAEVVEVHEENIDSDDLETKKEKKKKNSNGSSKKRRKSKKIKKEEDK